LYYPDEKILSIVGEDVLRKSTTLFNPKYVCLDGSVKTYLKKKKEKKKAFAESDILFILYSVSQALTFAHMKNIIHRNIKPSNIFINKNGQAKLGEFGIGAINEFHRNIWAAGDCEATSYASPELHKREPLTAKTDIFSLGVVLFELCSLVKPFHLNDQSIKKNICENEPNWRDIPPQYSEDLVNQIKLMLAKNPNKRPSSELVFYWAIKKIDSSSVENKLELEEIPEQNMEIALPKINKKNSSILGGQLLKSDYDWKALK
jgi:NIMA (never in mitosis gene a)-related kinase